MKLLQSDEMAANCIKRAIWSQKSAVQLLGPKIFLKSTEGADWGTVAFPLTTSPAEFITIHPNSSEAQLSILLEKHCTPLRGLDP